MKWTGATCLVLLVSRISAFYSPVDLRFLSNTRGRAFGPPRCQGVSRLDASPMDKFMSGLESMMSGKPEDADESVAQGPGDVQDLDSFRNSLIKQTRADGVKEEFSGYDMYDLIVDKFDVPYDVQINKTVFAGKPVLCFNVMWKYLGQSSFHLGEQEYLEHLQALAELLQEWDRVDQFKEALAETRKRPNPYFGYAVALPLDLPPDTLAGYFEDSYFE